MVGQSLFMSAVTRFAENLVLSEVMATYCHHLACLFGIFFLIIFWLLKFLFVKFVGLKLTFIIFPVFIYKLSQQR